MVLDPLQTQMENLNIPAETSAVPPVVEDDGDIEFAGFEGEDVLIGQGDESLDEEDTGMVVPEISVDEVNKGHSKEEEGWIEYISEEAPQLGGVIVKGIAEGMKEGVDFLTYDMPENIGFVYNVRDWAFDRVGQLKNAVSNAADKIFRNYETSPSEPVIDLLDRINVLGAKDEIENKTAKGKLKNDRWLAEYTKHLEVMGREKGWIDDIGYKWGKYLGDLVILPIGGKPIKRAMLASRPKQRVVEEAYELAKKDGGLKNVLKKYDAGVTDIVKKMFAINNTPDGVLAWRNVAYVTARGVGGHIKDAGQYGLGGALGSTIAYHGLKAIDGFTDEEAEGYAMWGGMIGLMTGYRPFVSVPGKFVRGTAGRLPIPGTKYDVGDITRMGLKIHHLGMYNYHLTKRNAVEANFHILRYSGASKGVARELSVNSDKSGQYLNSGAVDRQILDDAVSFMRTMQKLAADHPQFHEYIMAGRERLIEKQKQFQDVFVAPESEQAQRMKENFASRLRDMNEATGNFSNEALNDIVENFDPEDMGLMLDQLFMLDFLSSIRNMAVGQAKLATVSSKEAIELFTEGFDYNQAMSGQLQLIESAMWSLVQETSAGSATAKFLEDVQLTYKNVRKNMEASQDEITTLLKNVREEVGDITERAYKDELVNMTHLNRFDDLPEATKSDAEENLFQQQRDNAMNIKEYSAGKYAERYEEFDRVEISAEHVIGELSEQLIDNTVLDTLGGYGKTATQQVLETGGRLQKFKERLRQRGLHHKYDFEDIQTMDADELHIVATKISQHTRNAHSDIVDIESNFFFKNKYTNYNEPVGNTGRSTSPIQKVLQQFEDGKDVSIPDVKPMTVDEFKSKIKEAIRNELDEFSKLNSGNDFDIDKILNEVTEPRMDLGDARKIAVALWKKARDIDPTKGRASDKKHLNDMGFKILKGMDKGTDDSFAEGEIYDKLRKLSSDYRQNFTEMYYNGWGADIFNYNRDMMHKRDPISLREVFGGLLTKKSSGHAKKQFDKLYPVYDEKGVFIGDEIVAGKTLSKHREEAVDALMYSFGKYLHDGGKLENLGGNIMEKGDGFERFAENFEPIIGKDNIEKLVKYHQYVGGKYKLDERWVTKAVDTFQTEIQKINKETLERLGLSALAQYQKGLSSKTLVRMLLEGEAGTRAARKPTAEEMAEEAATVAKGQKVLDISNRVDDGDMTKAVRESQLPILKADQPLYGEAFEILIAENPALRQPLQDLFVHHLIEASIAPTMVRKLDRTSNSLSLERELRIDEFSNIFHGNMNVLKRLFNNDTEHLKRIQLIFENGVAHSGTNWALKIMNMAGEPTTQSRASRIFALQRQVVGMPYLATEQAVMAYQREKAAFLKRIVLDKDFAKMMYNVATQKDVAPAWINRFVQSIRVTYGENSVQKEDIPFLKRELMKDWEILEDPKNFTIDINRFSELMEHKLSRATLSRLIRGLKEYNLSYTLPKEERVKSFQLFAPHLEERQAYGIQAVKETLQLLPQSQKKLLQLHAKRSKAEASDLLNQEEQKSLHKKIVNNPGNLW